MFFKKKIPQKPRIIEHEEVSRQPRKERNNVNRCEIKFKRDSMGNPTDVKISEGCTPQQVKAIMGEKKEKREEG